MPRARAREHAGRAAFVMASTGESVCHAKFEAQTNRLAHRLLTQGCAVWVRWPSTVGKQRPVPGGPRGGSGPVITVINSYLTAPELAMFNNSTAKLLITSGMSGMWPSRRPATARG